MRTRTVEANLDAITITPKRERKELERYVYPPQITTVLFKASSPLELLTISPLCNALRRAAEEYRFSEDPYLMDLRQQNDERSRKQLASILQKPKTYCSTQLRTLDRRAATLFEQLGLQAAEWYVVSSIERFQEGMGGGVAALSDVTSREQQHLSELFKSILSAKTPKSCAPSSLAISDKAEKLVTLLTQQAAPSMRGLIFVEQRATVSALVHLIRSSPHTAVNCQVGGFIGTSSYAGRKSSIADLAESKKQEEDLKDFRNGVKNLIVSTNVLEEGIDVSACNLVICFDLPQTLVSFVQRRGRARQDQSKYYLFIAESDWKTDPLKWQKQEAEMRQAYMDETREHEPTIPEDEDALNTRVYRVESTGALLTLENAKAHLYHFCAVSTLQASNYVDVRPEFAAEEATGKKPWTASVTLPSFVHPEIRTASSSESWRSENAAIKDAAFEAYVALHIAGLLNDNLLPLIKDYGPEAGQEHVDQPSIVSVAERQSSWIKLAKLSIAGKWHLTTVSISLGDHNVVSIQLCVPVPMRGFDFILYWNEQTTYRVSCEATSLMRAVDDEKLEQCREHTHVLLSTVHANRMTATQSDFIVLSHPHQRQSTRRWLSKAAIPASAPEYFQHDVPKHECGLVRVKAQPGRSFIFDRVVQPDPRQKSGQVRLVVTAFPKRTDFLHPVPERQDVNTAYTVEQTFDVADCMVDNLPYPIALFAAFLPSIMHRIDVQLLAEELQATLLHHVGITNISQVIEAISSPSAGEEADYNRLEYLGDAILKFCAHLQVMAQHPTWPEGYLSMEKKRLVRNSTLAQAALEAGLDKYILTKSFTGKKWRPIYISEVLAAEHDGQREMSSKILADVVEALIGAAFVEGGLGKAYQCIQTLLPNETWYLDAEIYNRLTSDLAPCNHTSLGLLERLIGHRFSHPTLLVEAITHASLPFQRTGMSYERLEFLGDAVLDLIIVPKLFSHPRKLRHWQLHSVHEALVNGLFLGYCCMSYSIEQDKYAVVKDGKKLDIERSARIIHLHDFIRASGQVIRAKQMSLDAFEILRHPVQEALCDGKKYPWPDLLAMHPHKFFSDLVESVLGALYIDTQGDLTVCERFVENLGILDYMRIMLEGEMETMSPKECLGIAAGNLTVKYDTLAAAVEGDAGVKRFSCTVKVGGEEMATVDGCANKAEAEARGAIKAVEVMHAKAGTAATDAGRKRKLDTAMGDEDEAVGGAMNNEDAMEVDESDSDIETEA